MADGSVALGAAPSRGWSPGPAVPARIRRLRYGPLALGAALGLSAALLPMGLAVAVLAAVGLGALLLARPTLAIYLLVFSVPYESLHEIQLGGLNATATEFLAFCGGAAFLMRCAIDGQMRVRWAWWRWPLLLFGLAMAASMTQATSLTLSIKELLKLGEMLLTYLLVLTYVDTPTRLRRLLLLVVLAALSQALLGIGQTVAHFGPASFARGAVLRASGTFDQPNPFAGYLNLTLPLLLAAAAVRLARRAAGLDRGRRADHRRLYAPRSRAGGRRRRPRVRPAVRRAVRPGPGVGDRHGGHGARRQ
jgi:hypothetical protein